jgi:hypothetical protein
MGKREVRERAKAKTDGEEAWRVDVDDAHRRERVVEEDAVEDGQRHLEELRLSGGEGQHAL